MYETKICEFVKTASKNKVWVTNAERTDGKEFQKSPFTAKASWTISIPSGIVFSARIFEGFYQGMILLVLKYFHCLEDKL